jgi:predicted transcriptional regulator
MKVKHYNEMMAYLIRPGFNGGGSVSNNTVLPKRKPAAEVKKRKKINYEKIKQYLGKESQDLIERELGFAVGGGVSPNQLKQRFMELIISIQDAEAEEVPRLVAEAKDVKDKIDELNKVLAPERQIKITAEGLDFDNPLLDAAKIQESVKPVQTTPNVIKSITTENPALIAVPDFPRGDKGTGADPREKEDVFKREPGKRIATMPDGTVTKASMQMKRPTDLRDMIRNVLKKFDKEDLTATEGSFADGGRIGFSRGGAAKVYDYLESLPEGTEIDLNFVRDYVEKNNIDADADNVFKNFYEIDRKQKAASGNITFKHGEQRRKQLQTIKNKLVFKKLKEFIPATKENLEKLDNLIKNTDLNIEQIGKELGFKNPKSLKFAPTSKNVLVKEYIKKYGNLPEGRFKIGKLTPDSEIVKQAIELKETPLSTRQVARELGVTQSAVVNYFRAGDREDLVGEVPVKKEGTPVDRKKKARMENIAEGEKFASKSDKAFNKAEDLRVQKINTFIKNNSDQLINNPKFINLVNLKLDGKGNIISKNKSSEEITKLLKEDRLFERDHISSVAKRKRNMQFPVNFQLAPKNINQGFFGAAEAYVNRPDADPEKIKKLSNVLDQYGLRLSTNKGTIGAKQIPASEVMDRNLKALGLSTEIGKPSKGVTLGSTFANVDKEMLDFRKLPDDVKDVGNVIRDLIKTPGGKRIARNLIKAGRFTGLGLAGELAFAAPFAADDYASGLSGKRIIGNAFLASLTGIGESEQEEIRKATGERGYATQTLGDLGQKIPIIAEQLKAFNNQNDPTGAQRDKFTKIYNKVVNEYDQAYNLFVTDAGVFDKELYNQGVNNYAAGLGQIEKFRDLKEKERGVKEASKNITGLELDLNFAGGGLAKGAGEESGPPPESGPTPQGLASIIKRGRKY